ncbi:hypothetical protein Tco_1504506 [Tanacetum coccineum]
MTKVTDLEANLEQFKIEQAAINSEAAKQLALLQATIEKNKVEADQQFAEIMNALKALQPPTTLPEDTTTMIDTEKSGEDCGNLDEFMVASDVEEAAITTPIMVVAEELGQKLIYDFGDQSSVPEKDVPSHGLRKQQLGGLIFGAEVKIPVGFDLRTFEGLHCGLSRGQERRTWKPRITYPSSRRKHLSGLINNVSQHFELLAYRHAKRIVRRVWDPGVRITGGEC